MTDLIAAAWSFLAKEWAQSTDAAHDFGHIRRVCALAQTIAATEGPVDHEALDIACILHDLVNLPKAHPDRPRASTLSGAKARAWLMGQGWSADRAQIVDHAIAAHSFSAALPPQTAEARILQDADRIEAMGAIGLARMFAVSGALGRALFDDADPLARHRPLDDKAFALDHLETKIYRLTKSLQTETGRQMARQRIGFMQDFVAQVMAELGETQNARG